VIAVVDTAGTDDKNGSKKCKLQKMNGGIEK